MIFIYMKRKSSCRPAAIAVFVSLIVFCLPIFANALEIHHIFAEVDHDGHEHSDSDLCQWVQANGSGSTNFDQSDSHIFFHVRQEQLSVPESIYSFLTFTFQASRGPPLYS